MGVVVVFVFLALDIGFVAGGLWWLSERRAMSDRTNMRFREQRRRIR